jgi:hypothetical protein
VSNHGHEHEAREAAVFALRVDLDAPAAGAELRERLTAFVAQLAAELQRLGCPLIGHIKGAVDAGDAGVLYFSATSFVRRPDYRGELLATATRATFTVNVIAYGVREQAIGAAVRDGLAAHLARPTSFGA